MIFRKDQAKNTKPETHLPALSGIRFFAVLHIFCFHLWTVYDMKKGPGMENMLRDMGQLPETLLTWLANGWMSTSFFFLLSGFILAYLYWGEDGNLTISKRKFWLTRIIRIYPIHILLVLIAFLTMSQYHLSQGANPALLITSGIATLTLTQAWYPDLVPVWSWPTWTISALIFLYLCMPYLMPRLARLTRKQSILLLCLLPFISLLPTCIYAIYFPGPELKLFWHIFISSTPIFWLAHFIAGMLFTRVFYITRYNTNFMLGKKSWFAWGDLALVAIIAISCIPGIEPPFKYFLRHGLVMPLYMIIIIDLAKGNGLAARLFSLPGMDFLGETSFSIFIWQTFVTMLCWGMIMANPAGGDHQFLWALVILVGISIFSTYVLEKPLTKWLQRKWIK
jgi:peptidoglycan/LPS O-acetylase OafA/YrhL